MFTTFQSFAKKYTGVYNMQNTMVGGGGMVAGGKNEELGEKIKKGKEKGKKIT